MKSNIRGMRREVVVAVLLIAIGVIILLAVPTVYEGPLLLYINEQHGIRVVDAIGLIIAVPAWLYLCWHIKRVAIWSIYLVVFGCTLLFPTRLYPRDWSSLMISLGLMVGGAALFLAGKRTLGASHTTLPEARKLITDGIYARIRHPLYVGLQLVYWGLSVWLGSWVGAIMSVVLVLPLQFWRARVEEQVLAWEFGSIYQEYKARTIF